MAPSMERRAVAPTESFELGDDMQQTWRSHWLAFCGRCTPGDIISCCTAYCAPCVAYGWTTSRAFRTSFWKELGKFLLIFGIVGLLNIAFFIAQVATCPLPPDPTAAAPAGPPAPPTKACFILTIISQLGSYLSIGCGIAWAVHIGGPRRTQLRKLLGIADRGAGGDCCTCCYSGPDKGSASDCCLHYWCLCCALAQEMRTVMHLQSMNKMPEGPSEGYEPLITQAPAFDAGMTRVKGVPVDSMV